MFTGLSSEMASVRSPFEPPAVLPQIKFPFASHFNIRTSVMPPIVVVKGPSLLFLFENLLCKYCFDYQA
jgi:hypothetical protein